MPSNAPATLWVGGFSNLTRAYINLFGRDDLVLAGLETQAPSWASKESKYVTLDLRKTEFDSSLFKNITSIIFGIPFVIWENQNELLLVGLKAFLDQAVKEGVQYLVHISSLYTADHFRNQKKKTDDNGESFPLTVGPRGLFERQCEELINKYRCFESVHLRIGGIFCDSESCSNSNSFAIQSRVGPSQSMPVLVDFNSGRNISLAIKLLLENLQQENQVADEYYYTRPIRNKGRMTYGEYLEQYRKAYDITTFLPIPFSFFHALTWLLRQLNICIGFIQAVDYVLQASRQEQKYECSRFARDFASIVDREETIYECFKRQRHLKNSKGGE